MIAHCGLVCNDCPAYIATQKDDMDEIRKVAEMWSEMFKATVLAEDCICDGCAGNGRQIPHCSECKIRACAIERGVINCAYCDDYGCQKITTFLAHAPEAKAALEEIRRTLL